MRPARKRQLAKKLIDAYGISIKRSCSVVLLHRSGWYYKHHPREDEALRRRIREIAEVRVRYGVNRIFVLLRREGWKDNKKRAYRIYREEGLNLRNKRPRRSKSAVHRIERPDLTRIHQCWSMDFVSDQLFKGRRFRTLTVEDNFSRKCLAIYKNKSTTGIDVVHIMDEIRMTEQQITERIQVDNESEFISKGLYKWAYENEVVLDFSRPGKPTDNSFIESFYGSLRDECLNVNWFVSLQDAHEKIDQWKWEYNNFRPHSSLNHLTPVEFESLHDKGNHSSESVKVKLNVEQSSPALTESPECIDWRSKSYSKKQPLFKQKLQGNIDTKKLDHAINNMS